MRCFSDPEFRFQYIPMQVAVYNDMHGIEFIKAGYCTRAGLHCAHVAPFPMAHRPLANQHRFGRTLPAQTGMERHYS